MAALRSPNLLPALLFALLLTIRPGPAAAAWKDRRASLVPHEASLSMPTNRPQLEGSTWARSKALLSHVRAGVWSSWRHPLALAQLVASRSHVAQPGADVALPELDYADIEAAVIVAVCQLAAHTFIIGLAALLYVRNRPETVVAVPEAEGKASLDGKFKYGLFSCFDTPGLACFTCCCAGIRWSDSVRMAGLLAFPSAIIIVIGIHFCFTLLGGLVAWVILSILGTVYRRRIRRLFGMEDGSKATAVDCLTWCCCTCCAVVQEARQIEEAKLLGHDMVDVALPLQLSWREPWSDQSPSVRRLAEAP